MKNKTSGMAKKRSAYQPKNDPCKSCGDPAQEGCEGRCKDCYTELKTGKVPQPGPTDIQINSLACRVIRKGHEMS